MDTTNIKADRELFAEFLKTEFTCKTDGGAVIRMYVPSERLATASDHLDFNSLVATAISDAPEKHPYNVILDLMAEYPSEDPDGIVLSVAFDFAVFKQQREKAAAEEAV